MPFTISELTESEVNLILQALGEMPARLTLDIILKIKGQAVAQLQAASATVPA